MLVTLSTPSYRAAAKIIVFNAAFICLLLGAAELFLRYQDIVELDYENSAISELLHHNRPGKNEAHVDSHLYGECGAPAERFSILFLGDSWIQGGEIIDSFGKSLVAARKSGNDCFELLNAGVTSYSPLLYTLKAKSVAKHRQIDMVIVNIDETDLMDDWLRYRPAAVRDDDGNLIRVAFSRDLYNAMNHEAYVSMTRHKIYLLRLIKKAYYMGVERPAYERREKVRLPSYENILAPQLSSSPEKTHFEPVTYFHKSVDEMVRVLIHLVSDNKRVVLTFHPHYRGLTPAGNSERYNDVVPGILKKVSSKLGVMFYDAKEDAAESYGAVLEPYFTWPGDPFSHLTGRGYEVYGRLIAKRVAERISDDRGS